jgi:acylphosphatase
VIDVVTVRYWGGAQRAAGVHEEPVPFAGRTLGELRAALVGRPGLVAVCEVASFLVDGQHEGDDAVLHAGVTVDVLPPFAGGSSDLTRLHVYVTGHVQGVGFRYWARDEARARGLLGSATNLYDGRVEIVAIGSRPDCEGLLDAINGGRTPGRVVGVSVSWSLPGEVPDSFRVR